MSIQEAHASALADALSTLPGGQEGAPGTADVPATATFHPADPAIRLGPTIDLGGARGRPLSGAHVRIDTVRDGDAELLLYDLGGSRILPSIDYLPTHGVLDVHFVGVAPAETYARLLSSLRYINRAPHPTPGERSIEISVLDASGAETPVGRLDLTVVPNQPTPAADSGSPDVQDGGASPDLPVVWNAADGYARPEGILGWHRAGEAPRHMTTGAGAGQRGGLETAQPPQDEPDAATTVEPSDPPWGTATDIRDTAHSDDPSVFGDEALHLYGAAKLPLSWDGHRITALSQAGGRANPESATDDTAQVGVEKGQPVDYLRDGSDEGVPLITGGEYRIYSAAGRTAQDRSTPDAPRGMADETPASGAESGARSGGGSDTAPGTASGAPAWTGARLTDGAEAPWATPIDDPLVFEVLRPADVFETDGSGGADSVAAPPTSAIPRLDAFLVGLPPSGDPLLPPDGEAAA